MSFRRLPTAIAALSFVFTAGILTAGAAVSQQAGDFHLVCQPSKCVSDDKDPDIDPWHDTGPKDEED